MTEELSLNSVVSGKIETNTRCDSSGMGFIKMPLNLIRKNKEVGGLRDANFPNEEKSRRKNMEICEMVFPVLTNCDGNKTFPKRSSSRSKQAGKSAPC